MLAHTSYGKAEIHLVHLDRATAPHRVTDLTVSVDLQGDFAATHERGDNTDLLATDSQKNIVYAEARRAAPGAPEAFALRIARLLVGEYASVRRARVDVEARAWQPLPDGDTIADAAFSLDASRRRWATAVVEGDGAEHVLGGVAGLSLLKSADSGFSGFLRDRWTTLPETDDRILASAVVARWRYAGVEVDFDAEHAGAQAALVTSFARHDSRSLQQTLHAMGEAILDRSQAVVEVRLSMPNLHHLLVDLAPFGLDNPNVVFHADDRPYGLIEGVLLRDGAAPAESAWPGRLL